MRNVIKKKYIFSILITILCLSIGYASFSSLLTLDNILAYFRIPNEVRITNLEFDAATNDATDDFADYNYDRLNIGLNLPNQNSTITYNVSITNLGSPVVQLDDITGLPSNITYELVGLNLDENICVNNQCNLGITKTFQITFKYTNNGYDSSNPDGSYLITPIFVFKTALAVSYEANIFNTDYYDSGGLFIDYDTYTSVLTLNGSLSSSKDLMVLSGLSFSEGEEYKIDLTYNSGSYSLSGTGYFTTNILKSDNSAPSTPNAVNQTLPSSGSNNDSLIVNSSAASTGTKLHSYLNLSSGASVTFTNYRVKVKVYKSILSYLSQGDNYVLPSGTITRNRGTFLGWYTGETGGTQVTNSTVVSSSSDHTIYAHWDIKPETLYKVVKKEYDSNSGYAALYTGTHKDSYTRTGTKDIYYYTTPTTDDETEGNTLLDKINVIFGGFCWQIIRTTDTGGTKVIYNGTPVSGTCENDRGTINIIRQGAPSSQTLSSSYAYGTSYTFNESDGTFQLAGTTKVATYTNDKSVIGMYTCKNASVTATCSTLYYVQENTNFVSTSSTAYAYPISKNTTKYSNIGVSSYSNNRLLSYVGYMYNKTYNNNTFTAKCSTSAGCNYGATVSWSGSAYTLNSTITIANGSTPTTSQISTHHFFYTVMSPYTVIGYVYYFTGGTTAYYIDINDGLTTGNAVANKMLSASDVNSNNSGMKRYIEKWYANNLSSYDLYIDEAIYCNNRSVADYGTWTHNGGMPNTALTFKENALSNDLSCTNNTDQFSVSNTSAPLNYKVGLPTSPELYMFNNKYVRNTGEAYWTMSPFNSGSSQQLRRITNTGTISSSSVSTVSGIRPVISILPGATIVSGTGETDSPYVLIQ